MKINKYMLNEFNLIISLTCYIDFQENIIIYLTFLAYQQLFYTH